MQISHTKSKPEIKVLQVASFCGNVGDTANHIGTAWLRNEYLDYSLKIQQKEIREFYWKKWKFNSEEFIEEANSYDLIIIGGGNYFELWVEDSATGTSIDITIENLKKIKPPILFYGLGADIFNGYTSRTQERFSAFLDYLLNSNKYLICLRNDGAMSNIKTLYGTKYVNRLQIVPDGGFFYKAIDIHNEYCLIDAKNIVINLAGDMPDKRFPEQEGGIRAEEFFRELSEVLTSLKEKYGNINYIFAPHIYRDIEPISKVLQYLPDELRRRNVTVLPYQSGVAGCNNIFNTYRCADLVLGMRFHANVVSIALEKSVIGLVNYNQVKNLYNEMGCNEYVIVNERFHDQLFAKIVKHLEFKEKYEEQSKQLKRKLLEQASCVYKEINQWLQINLMK